jgi:hypothetical protein
MHASHVAEIPTALALAFATSCMACGGGAPRTHYDVVIAGGTVYDGSGASGVKADVGWVGDEIKAVGDLRDADATTVVRADGLAVAPGFVNMMSGDEPLRVDGRSMSDIKQGVTTEIFGEGDSMGPLNDEMRARRLANQGDLKYPHYLVDAARRNARSGKAWRVVQFRLVHRRGDVARVCGRPRRQEGQA